jgi:hypothetical protein
MPFLRQEPDDTLASTLGNLGSALGAALNPMNQFRAQDVLAQIQQRQWEIQQARRIDASNQNAASVFRQANPYNQDPASLEATATQIGQGKYDPAQWVSAATGLVKQRAAQAAADAVDTDPDMQSATPAERASVKEIVLNGTSLADAKSQIANERLTSAKTTRGIAGSDAAASAASQPGMTPELGPLAASEALTDPGAAEKLIAGGRARATSTTLPADTSITSPAVSGLTADQAAAGQPAVLPAQLQPQADVRTIVQKNIEAQSAPRAPDLIVPAVPPVDVTTGAPLPVTPTPPSPPPSPDGKPTPTPAPTPTPLPPGGFTQAPQGPNTQAITSSKSAATAADEGTKFRAADVTADMESGRKANDMLRTVALMRQYANLLDNNAPLGQLSMAFVQRVKDELGVTLDPNQSARNAFEQLGNSLIAETHKDDGVLRVAGPELNFFSRTLPNAQQDRPSLMRALDNLEIKARNLIAVGRRARDVYGATGGNVDAASYTGYTADRDKILAPPTLNQPIGAADTTPVTGGKKIVTPPKGVTILKQNPDGTYSVHDASEQ